MVPKYEGIIGEKVYKGVGRPGKSDRRNAFIIYFGRIIGSYGGNFAIGIK